MQNVAENHEAVIWKLVRIEENVHKLALMLEAEPLHRREAIKTLLREIEEIAIRSRRRLIEAGMPELQHNSSDREKIVTAKEIRELLEAFA